MASFNINFNTQRLSNVCQPSGFFLVNSLRALYDKYNIKEKEI